MSDPISRPDHPDLWLLSEILLDLDAQSDNATGEFADITDRMIPHEVAVYVALQRSLRVIKAGIAPPGAEMVLSATWLDGFIAGMMFQAKKDL